MKRKIFAIVLIIAIITTLSMNLTIIKAAPSVKLQNAINQAPLHPMKTGYLALDNKVQEILSSCGYGQSDTYTVVKNCYAYLARHYYYERITMYPYDDYVDGTPTLINEWAMYAYAPLFLGKGDCYNYAFAFAVLTRAIGLRAYVVGDGDGFNSTHHWTQIDINGVLYDFDPQIEGANTRNGNVKFIRFGNPGSSNPHYLKKASRVEDVLPENAFKTYSHEDFANQLTWMTYGDFTDCDCRLNHIYKSVSLGDIYGETSFKRLHFKKLYLVAPYQKEVLEQMVAEKFNKVVPLKELPEEFAKRLISEEKYNSCIYDTEYEWKVAIKATVFFLRDYEADRAEYADVCLYNGGVFNEEISVDGGTLLVSKIGPVIDVGRGGMINLVEIGGYLGNPERIHITDSRKNTVSEKLNGIHNVYSLADSAFYNCKSLKYVKLPLEQLNALDPFFNCTNLETLYLDSDINYMRPAFFYFTNCNNLKTIVFDGNIDSSVLNVDFSDMESNITDINIYSRFPTDRMAYFAFPGQKEYSMVGITVDNKCVDFDQPPVVIENRTLAPVRAIFEAMNMTVNWDGATETVTASDSQKTVTLTLGSNDVWVNGEKLVSDVPAQAINGRVLIPVRIVSEAFDFRVDWNNDTKQVHLKSPDYKEPDTNVASDSDMYADENSNTVFDLKEMREYQLANDPGMSMTENEYLKLSSSGNILTITGKSENPENNPATGEYKHFFMFSFEAKDGALSSLWGYLLPDKNGVISRSIDLSSLSVGEKVEIMLRYDKNGLYKYGSIWDSGKQVFTEEYIIFKDENGKIHFCK